MRVFLVGVAVLLFVTFGLAMRILFDGGSGPAVRMRILAVLGLLCAVAQTYWLITMPLPAWAAALAAFIYLASLALFSWAAFSIRTHQFGLAYSAELASAVFSGGPFRWIRHPFYLSYALAWLAGGVAVGQWYAFVPLAVMSAFYVDAARLEERRMLNGAVAEEYRTYRARAGAIVPHLWRKRGGAHARDAQSPTHP